MSVAHPRRRRRAATAANAPCDGAARSLTQTSLPGDKGSSAGADAAPGALRPPGAPQIPCPRHFSSASRRTHRRRNSSLRASRSSCASCAATSASKALRATSSSLLKCLRGISRSTATGPLALKAYRAAAPECERPNRSGGAPSMRSRGRPLACSSSIVSGSRPSCDPSSTLSAARERADSSRRDAGRIRAARALSSLERTSASAGGRREVEMPHLERASVGGRGERFRRRGAASASSAAGGSSRPSCQCRENSGLVQPRPGRSGRADRRPAGPIPGSASGEPAALSGRGVAAADLLPG